MPEVRIQKALADAGVASRRAAEALVAAGRVTIGDRPASIGQRVDPERDHINVDGRPLRARPEPVYLVLDKPAGVTSTVADRHAQRTVVELVPREIRARAGRLYPVGRLDRDSEGLLLLTNDGDWAERLLHPRHEVEREYAVGLATALRPEQERRLLDGIELEEGIARLLALRAATPTETRALAGAIDPPPGRMAWYRATIGQGWKRQLRRMFAAVGAPVSRLVRVRIGTLRLAGLRPGEVHLLSAREAARLAAALPREAGTRAEAARSDAVGDRRKAPARHLVVSLDGPGSSGKSTVGAGAASRLGYRFCDTGLFYRALTWLALQRAVDLADEAALVALVPAVTLTPDGEGRLTRVRVDGADVTARVHSARVDRHVSEVARQPRVREALLGVQRGLADGGGIIMAGRDIGTVVLPAADLKLWLQVSPEERARRRAGERGLDPDGAEAHRLAGELRERDRIDASRPVAPMRVPEGAVVIESDGNTLEQTIEAVVLAVRAAERRR
ncbi:MAG TPA: (d)CMP kinase [Candidatus Limnocylindrales bacterium]|nr:(d)CMP kinase [Candidatus Limnocylindrales bacterium]